MKIIRGRYNEAKVFTDRIEEGAEEQIKALCDTEAYAGERIRIMPDVHAGAGCTIGTSMTVSDKVSPNMVGVDIGCGMELVELQERDIDFAALDGCIREGIPSGMNCRALPHPFAERAALAGLKCFAHVDEELARRSVGTLGGGNHFIEMDEDEEGKKYLVIHSGSRHLGLEVAAYYQSEGYKQLCGNSAAQIRERIAALKEAGRQREIQAAIQEMKEKRADIPAERAYVSGGLFRDYIADMKIVQAFADLNRRAMAEVILRTMRLTPSDRFATVHNYIDTEKMILRKGAVSAEKGERLLVPVNMRDGAFLCVGKGSEDWNCSAPHGAGRLMSRGRAAATLSVEEFRRQMEGVYTTCVGEGTLDESPMAYKGMEEIAANISPTAEIVKRLRPVYNFKAGEEDRGRAIRN